MKRLGAAIAKRIRRWWSLQRRGHHRRLGHLVYSTPIRDYSVRDGEFEFYWRRGHRCRTCEKEWPTYR